MLAILQQSGLTPTSASVPTQAGAAAAVAYILWAVQRAKTIPWVTQHTVYINTAVRLVLSGLATAGITVAWSHDTHQLVIGNLYAASVIAGLWRWFTQYATAHLFEKILYAGSQKPPTG